HSSHTLLLFPTRRSSDLSRQRLNDALAGSAQALNGLPQMEIMAVGRPDASRRGNAVALAEVDQRLEVGGKTGGRTRPAEHRADGVVAATLGDGGALARHERGEHHAGV